MRKKSFFEKVYYYETSKSAIKRDSLILFGMALASIGWSQNPNVYVMKYTGIISLIILGLCWFIMLTLDSDKPSKTTDSAES